MLASLEQKLRKLSLFKPWQSREPLHDIIVLGCCLRITPNSNCHISKLISLIEVFLSILESSCNKLRIPCGLTLVIPSLHGWEALSTLGALTHTGITWALTNNATMPDVISRLPLYPWCFGHSLWRRAQQLYTSPKPSQSG